jgi:hypothetical protein
VTARSRRNAGALAACCSCFGSPLIGQTTATLDLGASYVEYDGFLASGAAVFSSALRHDAANLSIGGVGSWTVFESGNQILQATAAGAWLSSPRARRWRLELAGALGAARYAEEPVSGHMLGRTRVHVFGERAGGWLGMTTGASFGDSARVPVEIAAAAWTGQHDLALVGTIAAARLGRYRHLDLLGTARWTHSPLEVEARISIRPWAEGDGTDDRERASTGLYGDVSLFMSVSERISIAVSGGSYPSDPLRRLLAARHVDAGVRLRFVGRDVRSASAISDATLAAALGRLTMQTTGQARLEIAPAGDPRMLTVHAPGATSVELMGDFTDWQPATLRQAGAGTWEILLPLTPGVHRVNVRLDGGPWIVPAGARPERSDFGGVVGVVVVR